MKKIIWHAVLIVMVLFVVSCGTKEKNFEKSAWDEEIDGYYINRESMVNDLMTKHLHIGMSYKDLTALVGPPENFGNLKQNTIGYEIMVDYGWDIDPVEGKTLYIELSKDSTVIGYKLEHWKH